MNDTIYRQEAIDAMEGLPKYFDKTDTLCLDYADVLAVLSEHLPSAQSDLEAKILAAGYTGKEVRIYIGGRLFGVRELAQ